MRSSRPETSGEQGTLDDLGTPLVGVTFVVFDLETTGGSAAEDAITEIGAVKVRGGEVLGEFATLVDPGSPIPPFITVLTGITQAMLVRAPKIDSVLPSFLEWARGCVLVAHNAPFDVGFMRAACAKHAYPWPHFAVVDTVDLARRALTRDEVPNHKLATLARFFRSPTEPIHRALADARATVHVLHGLIERLGSFDVTSLEELKSFAKAPTPEQRRKRHLAEGIPSAPGVYVFEDARGEVLYVGKSGDLRARVRSYFTGSETRRRVREMVGIAERVRPIVCPTGLEAEIRELRLIAEHKPRYNRRSRYPERALWLKLADSEPFPRLTIVRDCRDDGSAYLGPFGSTRAAEEARAALHDAVPLRQCTQRLSPGIVAAGKARTCVLSEIGRCGAPCEGRESPADYARHVRAARSAMEADVRPVVAAAQARIDRLSHEQRYEEAAGERDRLTTFLRAAARSQRLVALATCPQVVVARPGFAGGWELAVLRFGRLAGTGTIPPNVHPRPYVDALIATAETVRPTKSHPGEAAPAPEAPQPVQPPQPAQTLPGVETSHGVGTNHGVRTSQGVGTSQGVETVPGVGTVPGVETGGVVGGRRGVKSGRGAASARDARAGQGDQIAQEAAQQGVGVVGTAGVSGGRGVWVPQARGGDGESTRDVVPERDGRGAGRARAATRSERRPLLEATAEEMECALRWMAQPGTRLVEVEGEWIYPVHGAEAVLAARPELRHDRDRRLPVQ